MSYQHPHHRFVRAARTHSAALRAPLAAIAIACTLAACGGDGVTLPSGTSNNTQPPGPGPGPGPSPTPHVQGTSGALTTVGNTTTGLGDTIASTALPGVSSGVSQGLGDTVTATGSVLGSAANALSNGLGQTGTVSDPVGITAAGLGPTVSATSGVVAGAAATVDALGTGNLSPLSPVTTPVAATLYTAANGVNAAGQILGNTLASSSVQQLTQPVSNAITPLVVTLGQATQTVGTTTGLGAPVANVLGQVGSALQSAGTQIGGSTQNPLGSNVGQLVSSVGNTVTNAGGLVDPNAPNGALPIPGLITSLVGSSTTTVAGGTPGAASSGPLSSLAGLLGGSNVVSSGGGANPLSAVTGTVSSLTGSLTGSATGATSSTSNGGLGALLGNGLPLGKLP